jgi:hypothetical protein
MLDARSLRHRRKHIAPGGGGGPAPIPASALLYNDTVEEDVAIVWTLGSDGKVYSGAAVGPTLRYTWIWYGANTDFQVRYTKNSGFAVTSVPMDVWLDTTADTSLRYGGTAGKSGVFTVQIRRKSDFVYLTGCVVSMNKGSIDTGGP